MDLATGALVGAVFVLGGLVKGVTGLGLPTVSLALLSLFLPLTEAMGLILVPSLATNLLQGATGGHGRALLRQLWPMLAALCLGVWLAASFLHLGSSAMAEGVLGLTLCAYAVLGLLRPAGLLGASKQRLLGPLAGLVTGGLTALTGSFVLPSVPYLQALGLPRAALVQAMGLVFSVATLALGGALTAGGLPARGWLLSALAVLPAAAGMAAGARLGRAMQPQTFRRWLFICLAGLGLHLVVRGFYAG